MESSVAIAQEEHGSTSDIAKAAQNPIADMISIPFQNNLNFAVGPHSKSQNILNIEQPPDVKQMSLQPFVNYNFPGSW